MNKASLRKQYLEKRRSLAGEELAAITNKINSHFFSLDFSGVSYLHLFYPIAGKLEFNSLTLANWLRTHYPEIKLVLSRSNFDTHTLTHFIWNEDTPMETNAWGITEPLSGQTVSPDLLDMILVPLLAFDILGNRIGYGKGFYDRFLSECRLDTQKIGLSFFEPVARIEDLNEFDIPLDKCISPERIWIFNH